VLRGVRLLCYLNRSVSLIYVLSLRLRHSGINSDLKDAVKANPIFEGGERAIRL
jgi:hypothetical protein